MNTDDIVTRLRELPNKNYSEHGVVVSLEDCLKIADEIEHLRNAIKVRDLQILANFKVMDAMHKEMYGDAD